MIKIDTLKQMLSLGPDVECLAYGNSWDHILFAFFVRDQRYLYATLEDNGDLMIIGPRGTLCWYHRMDHQTFIPGQTPVPADLWYRTTGEYLVNFGHNLERYRAGGQNSWNQSFKDYLKMLDEVL